MTEIYFDLVRDASRGQLPCYKRGYGITWGDTGKNGRRRIRIIIDLESSWKLAVQWARRNHDSVFREFFTQLLLTMDHEYAHAFEPPRFNHKKGEKLATHFEREARLLRSGRGRRF